MSVVAEETDIVAGYRALADWLEQHPDYAESVTVGQCNLWLDTKDDLVSFKRASGAKQLAKGAIGDYFWLSLEFGGGVTLEANVPREQACRRVVTGTTEIPEEIVPAHVEETVEWECDPLLADPVSA